MELKSVPTRGRTLDHAAFVYDIFEPVLFLGKQAEYDKHIVSLLKSRGSDRILDLGCGTGVLTRMIADRLNADEGGEAIGIDAAAKMISVARKKRSTVNCRFEAMAAESLSFEDAYFDSVVSSLFFHHVPLNLKEKALPHELSSGETQRVAVARAIAHNPKMLLADEPTASLDTATGQRIVQLMRDLGQAHNCTIIIATHDMDIAETADLVINLKDGHILKVEE